MKTNNFSKVIQIPIGKINLEGEIYIPYGSEALVIFAHGSGSSRFSTRNNFVAKELHKQNISTFLFDLLNKEEDEIYFNRFDIDLLTKRLIQTTNHIAALPQYSDLRIGYFGASTGAASALKAAVSLPKIISAVVSRGGRPDLAMEVVPEVKVPTLLIVGARDYEVLNLNQKVYDNLKCDKKLEIVPGATHLFEEPGTLDIAAKFATDWFKLYLQKKIQQEVTTK